MNVRSLLFVLFFSFVSVLSAHAQRGKKNKGSLGDTSKVVVSDRLKSEAAFLDGMKYFMLQEYDKAIDNYRESLKIDKKNPAAHFQIGRARHASGRTEEAFYSLKQAIKLDPQNPYYYTFLAELYESTQQFDKAIKTYETLLEDVEESRKSYEALALLYLQGGDYNRALGNLNKIEALYGPSLNVMRRRQLIYLQEERIDKAIEEGRKIIQSFPDVTPYVLQQADMLLNQGENAEVKTLLEDLLEREPNTPEAHLLLANIYYAEGEMEKYAASVQAAFDSPSLDIEAKLEMLVRYTQMAGGSSGARQVGMELIQKTIALHPEDSRPHIVLGDFYILQGNLKEAEKAYANALERDGNNFKLWEQVIQLALNVGDAKAAVEYSEKALELYPNQADFWLYAGLAHYQGQRYEDAEFSLQQGKMLARNNELKSRFQAQLGDVYHALEDFRKSDEAFEEAIKLDAANAHAINNYSYFLSLRKEKLKRAKELSAQLVEKYPNNVTYLDTHGWVLYQGGEYEKAAELLEKAAQGNPNDPTVLEHYGDALFRLRKKEEALEFWRRAKEKSSNPSPELLQKVERGEL